MSAVFRACSIAIAIAAVIDPSIRIQRELALPVRLRLDERDAEAVAVRDRLARSLEGRVDLREYGAPAAIVSIEEPASDEPLPLTAPLSTISLAGEVDVAIADVAARLSLPAGSSVNVPVVLYGRGMRGATSMVTVTERGVELGRVAHVWTGDGYATVSVPYLVVAEGVHRLTVAIGQAPGESRLLNNTADINVLVTDRPARVAVVEARPSWQAGFVRRALEDDPRFSVSSILRISKGVAARTGDVSREVRGRQLDAFDVVLIGAPEELRTSEVEALSEFAERRGGTVILLPDTKASGAYQVLLPASPSEQLLQQPQALMPAGVMASELLGFREDAFTDGVLGRFGRKAVILSWTVGDGRFVFSGALDAWRYRAESKSAFTRFWRETVASAALTSPPRLDATLDPAVVRPHDHSRLTVRLRRTEFPDPQRANASTTFPSVTASHVDPAGQSSMIRLWPVAEPGVFEGDVSASVSGLHHIRVTSDTDAAADAVLIVDSSAIPAHGRRLDGLPGLTGGVSVHASNLEPLTRHLLSLPRPSRRSVIYPMRSVWWMVPFASCLCVEWFLRRRTGER